MKPIYRAKPYIPNDIKDSILETFKEILDTGGLIQGKYVSEFEGEVKELVKVSNAVATTSCGTGLETVLIASGIKNKKFIVPTQTFAASVNCIIRSGNEPLIVDVDEVTQCLSIDIIKENFSEDVGGVVLVHMSGLITPEIVEIENFCKDNNLFLLTDDAHAYGASYYDTYGGEVRCAGSFGDAGVFSFYPSKIITTAEGGMITTNNNELAEKCKILRKNGADGRYHHVEIGWNAKMPDPNAALGISQLKRIDKILDKKNQLADYYNKKLEGISEITIPTIRDYNKHTFMLYVILFKNNGLREKIRIGLENKGVETRINFPPLHLQPIYKKLYKFIKIIKHNCDCIHKRKMFPV